MLSEDAHLTRLGGNVDLDTVKQLVSMIPIVSCLLQVWRGEDVHISRLVDSLHTNKVSMVRAIASREPIKSLKKAYLVREC